MFPKTNTNPQFDLFTAPSSILPKRAKKKYTDEKAWHNQFFKLVTSQIGEEAFKPSFEETRMGAPNASVRTLVAMSILKKDFDCNDKDLFAKCEFDLLARKALGLEMLDDKPLSLDTYYLLGRRLADYEQRTSINLMERCFEQITGEQMKLFKISDNSARMDSKLIGSNIAQYSRYELNHRKLCKVLRENTIMVMLNPKLCKGAEAWLSEDSCKTGYHSNKDEMLQKLIKIGLYIYNVLKRLKEDAPGYELLHRIFHDQYVVEKGKESTHPRRYFNEEEVKRPELRRKIESLPLEEQHKRNDIEATMFLYSFHTRNGKTRYRGLLNRNPTF